VVRWRNGEEVGLKIKRLQVFEQRLWASRLQTCVSDTKQYNLVPASVGKVTARLAPHTGHETEALVQIVPLTPYGLPGHSKGDERTPLTQLRHRGHYFALPTIHLEFNKRHFVARVLFDYGMFDVCHVFVL